MRLDRRRRDRAAPVDLAAAVPRHSVRYDDGMPVRDLLIIGAGPSGLAAAIAAKRHGLDYQVIEKGTLVNSIYHFPPQMVFFTTPELLEIGGIPLTSPFEKPTRAEALRYYRRVMDAFDLQVSMGEEVVAVSRDDEVDAGEEPSDGAAFAVETRSDRGVTRVRHARTVILAIGYYDIPNRLGIPGEDLPHVHHYYGEPHPYYRKRVVIVGGGNSAAESALEMFRAGVHVTLVHRHAELKSTIKYWVRPDIENRIREGSIPARFETRITEIRPNSVVVTSTHAESTAVEELPADAVFLLIGYHADWDLMAAAGIELTDRRAPCLDPETFETNVRGLFVAGGAVAGMDTGNIFIENGRFHGEKIVDAIARRLHA
ncbi:MAG TPA: YpdA family putative bacillithiol disulfide reductase [Vicinamibacterales bacterium]|nr:YpdA family putative bacillithiol disulfide reductase [Vicinamibacterales bacterium]